jgi:hypothetical protein
MNRFSDIGLGSIQNGGRVCRIRDSYNPTKTNSRVLMKSGDLGGQFKSRNRQTGRCGNISRNFSILIRAAYDVAPSIWNHTVARVPNQILVHAVRTYDL